jgi:hypothetical protein
MIEPWPPTRYTEPLDPSFDSLFDRYRAAFRIAWHKSRGYCLEAWQEQLLRAITELRPDGHLRYRQVLVSLGRQNGKSEILAALGLLFMLWKPAPYVVGIASNREQAQLVYDRAMSVILGNAGLHKRFARLTGTRGISTKTGGLWELKAAKSASLQGIPVDLGAVDEVHIVKPALWTDLVNGTGGRPDCIVVGITTAGDDDSELLLHLYGLDDGGSLGRFIWEAPEAEVPEDDDLLADYLRAANPATASGRMPIEAAIEDVRSMPPKDAIRFRLNRFVEGKADDLVPMTTWAGLRVAKGAPWPTGSPLYFAIDAPFGFETAVIAAATKDGDQTRTRLVAGWANPSPSVARIVNACSVLYAKHSPASFVVDGFSGKLIADELRRRGLPVIVTSRGDVLALSAIFYAKVTGKRIVHEGDELLTMQLPSAQRKTAGEAWRIVGRRGSAFGIDAVMATAAAVWAVETQQEVEPQMFF